jgi:hypothetical protein
MPTRKTSNKKGSKKTADFSSVSPNLQADIYAADKKRGLNVISLYKV